MPQVLAVLQACLHALLAASNDPELRLGQTPLLCAVTAFARGDEVKRSAARRVDTVRLLLQVGCLLSSPDSYR